MASNNEKLQDELEHARANYWILTVICGIFLALFLNKIRLLEIDEVVVIYSLFLLGVGYSCLKLSSYIKKLKSALSK